MVGRPSKYDSKYCQEVIDYMAQGKSKEAFAGHISVSKQAVYRWIAKHKKFRNSIKIAEAKCQDFWEEMGIQMALAGQGNATVWIFNMKNRFHWVDSQENVFKGGGFLIKLDAGNNVQSTGKVSSETA